MYFAQNFRLVIFYKPALKLVEYLHAAAESKSPVRLKASTFYTLYNCIFIIANVHTRGVGNVKVVLHNTYMHSALKFEKSENLGIASTAKMAIF